MDTTKEPENAAKPEKRQVRRDGQIIEKVPSKKYLVRLFLGRDTSGIRHYFSATVRGNRKDAEKALRELMRRHELGESLRITEMTLNDFLAEWLQAVKLRTREATATLYEKLAKRHIAPPLGKRLLRDITPADIRTLELKLKDDGYASATQRYVHGLLVNIFRQAEIDGHIRRNPLRGIPAPMLERKERNVPTSEQARLILQEADKRGLALLFGFAFVTGMRACEYLALKWADVDWEAGTIKVQRSLNWKNSNIWKIEAPKTQKSRRTLRLTPLLLNQLKEQRRQQMVLRLKAGSDWAGHDFIFTNASGNPLGRDSLRLKFLQCVKAVGLPYFQYRSTRHALATELMVKKVNPKVVSQQLGHADVAITLRAYSHVTTGLEEEASETATKAFLG